MEKWQEKLILGRAPTEVPGQSEVGVIGEADMEATALAQAEEVCQRSRGLLITQGWCLWRCTVLRGEVIVVARDGEVTGMPSGIPVYSGDELQELCQDDVSDATLRLVHEAKKLAGAKVISAEGGD